MSILEVKKAIDAVKRGKATGIDNIPIEETKMITAVRSYMSYLIFALIIVLCLLTGVNV